MVEWSCTIERLNERGPYILVEWSCAKKRKRSVGALNSGWMVMHIALTVQFVIFKPWIVPWNLNSLFSKFFCYITRFVTWHLIRCKNGWLAKALMFLWNNSLQFNPFLMEADIIKKPVHWFVENGEYNFSTAGIGAILGNRCAIQGKKYVALLQGSETTTGFHHRSCILCL